MITGNETLLYLSENYPDIVAELSKHGLASYFEPNNLRKLGAFTKLGTLLQTSGLHKEHLIQALNQSRSISASVSQEQDVATIMRNLDYMAMLPCGLRNPFKEHLEKQIFDNPSIYAGLNYLTEGNVNHELSYYPLLDKAQSVDELPDIFMASDINNCFHRPFVDRFVNTGAFATYTPFTPNPYLEEYGFADPQGNYTMFTANMLVMVVDTFKLGGRPMPRKWEDLLSPYFEDDVVMRGEDDFFCNAVMLPIYKDAGFDGVKAFARSIKSGKHPAEMVKLAGTNKDGAATVYVMPYFFAKRIKSENVKIVWPTDGAIASPVFMMVKKKASEKHHALLNFLLGVQTGEMLVGRHFPSIHPQVVNQLPKPVKWLGWDFLNNNDMAELKGQIKLTVDEQLK